MATLSNSGFTRRSAFSGNSEGSHPRRPDQSEAGKNPVKAPIHVDAEKTPSAHFDFISFLMTAQRCGIPFLPINYNDELPRVGEGGDGIIREFQVTSKTKFVFKSTKLKSGDGAEDFKIQERRIYRALQEEIIILANSEIRHHPNIVQLEGICWDVAPKTALGRVLPVLVYERAPFGDLSSFLEETGRAIGTQSRMDLCFEIGQGLAIMHTKRIVHGDMKPKNILIFPKAEGGFVPRLTDFGYSSASLLDTDTLRVGLSRGWSASVPECYSRTNGLFSLSEVKKMDIYCYGLVFWSTLFGEEFEKGKLPEASDFSRFSSCFSQKQLDVLLRGFSSILQDDPKDRPTMDSVLESLAEVQISRVGLRPLYPDIGQDEHDYQPTQNVQNSNRMVSIPLPDYDKMMERQFKDWFEPAKILNSDAIAAFHQRAFSIAIDLNIFYQCHYRFRKFIFDCLQSRAKDVECEQCGWSTALQLALCYRIGFGVDRNEDESKRWQNKCFKISENEANKDWGSSDAYRSERNVSEELRRSKHPRDLFESVNLSNLMRMGSLETMDYVQEYRQLGGLSTARDHMQIELNDMKSVLGGYHPAVISHSRILAAVIAALCEFQPAIKLISDRLEDLKSMPANFMERRDPFLDIDRGTIVKTLLGGTDKKAIEDQVHLDLLRLELEHQHASLLRQQGLSSVAKSIYERITEEQESLFGERHLISARAKEGLAMSLFDLKKYREAVQYHNGAISVVEERLGSSHHELRRLRNNLAISFAKLKMLNDSEALFQSLSPDLIEIINSVKKQSPPDEKQISVSEKKEPLPSGEDSLYMMCNRVVLAYLRGGHEKARSALLILQEKMNDLFEERNPGPLICDYNMAVILAAHGQSMYPEAKAKFRKSLADLKALLGDKHPISQEALANFSLFDKLIVPDELVHGMSQLKLDIATASAPPSLVRLPQPILMQLEERFTPKRGTSLIDPEWFNELKERFKEKPEDIIGGKEKQIKTSLSKAVHIVQEKKCLNDEIDKTQVEGVNYDTSRYNVLDLISHETSDQSDEMDDINISEPNRVHCVVSDENSELLIWVGFRVPVKIRSIRLTSFAEYPKISSVTSNTPSVCRPKIMTLFKNVGLGAYFELGEMKDRIEFKIEENDWDSENGVVELQAGKNFPRLQKIRDLNILLSQGTNPDCLEDDEARTRLDRIYFFGDT